MKINVEIVTPEVCINNFFCMSDLSIDLQAKCIIIQTGPQHYIHALLACCYSYVITSFRIVLLAL